MKKNVLLLSEFANLQHATQFNEFVFIAINMLSISYLAGEFFPSNRTAEKDMDICYNMNFREISEKK